MALFNFGWFAPREHRVFNYKPRYYDPDEEARKEMFGRVDGRYDKEKKDGTYVPGSSIQGAFRNGNYQRTRGHATKAQSVISLVGLLLLALAMIYFAKIFQLL